MDLRQPFSEGSKSIATPVRANCRRRVARPGAAAFCGGLALELPATKGDWYAAQAGLQLLLELTNLRVLGLDQAELDRLACCRVKSLAQAPALRMN